MVHRVGTHGDILKTAPIWALDKFNFWDGMSAAVIGGLVGKLEDTPFLTPKFESIFSADFPTQCH